MHKFVHLVNTYDIWLEEVEFDDDDEPSVDIPDILEPIFNEMGCEYHHCDIADPDAEEIPDIIPENHVYHLADCSEIYIPDTFYFGSETHYNEFKEYFPTDNRTLVQLYLKDFPKLSWEQFPKLAEQQNHLFNDKMYEFFETHNIRSIDEEAVMQNNVVDGAVTLDLSTPTVVFRTTRFGYLNDVWFINCADLAALFKLTYG